MALYTKKKLVSVIVFNFLMLLITTSLCNAQNTAQKTVNVNIAGFAFDPSSVQISAGDTVKWINKDSVQHQIHGDIFDSELISNGNTYEFTFTKPGVYNYICLIHPTMKGTITVV
jgi:plastocyanin